MNVCFSRGQRLEESLEYQQFVANVEEEEAWINEKLNLVGSEDYGDTLAAVQVCKTPKYITVNMCLTLAMSLLNSEETSLSHRAC